MECSNYRYHTNEQQTAAWDEASGPANVDPWHVEEMRNCLDDESMRSLTVMMEQ